MYTIIPQLQLLKESQNVEIDEIFSTLEFLIKIYHLNKQQLRIEDSFDLNEDNRFKIFKQCEFRIAMNEKKITPFLLKEIYL